LPHQTKKQVLKELRAIEQTGAIPVTGNLKPYPGTILWKEYDHKDKIEEYQKLDDFHTTLNKSDMTNKEIKEIVEKHKKKYFLAFKKIYLQTTIINKLKNECLRA
jgi:hypothetical protein